jgi:hypothetical protein
VPLNSGHVFVAADPHRRADGRAEHLDAPALPLRRVSARESRRREQLAVLPALDGDGADHRLDRHQRRASEASPAQAEGLRIAGAGPGAARRVAGFRATTGKEEDAAESGTGEEETPSHEHRLHDAPRDVPCMIALPKPFGASSAS